MPPTRGEKINYKLGTIEDCLNCNSSVLQGLIYRFVRVGKGVTEGGLISRLDLDKGLVRQVGTANRVELLCRDPHPINRLYFSRLLHG